MNTRSPRTFVLSGLISIVMLLILAGCTMVQPLESDPMAGAVATPQAEAEATDDAMTEGETWYAYVGSYTRGAPGGWSEQAEQSPSEGIAVFAVDPETGAMEHIQTVASENPSFLTLHPNQSYLYVLNEIADYEGESAGSMEAYAIDEETGELTLINRQSVDSIPAQLVVDPSGSYLIVANYVGGSYEVLPINEDGSLEPVSDRIVQEGSGPHDRQEAPHPHAVALDPAGNFIATADLGIDSLQIFELDEGRLVQVSEASVAPGSGPRHVAFHPNGEVLYVINELTATITAFAFDSETGQIGEELQNIGTVPDDFPEHKSTAEIMVHPSGNFLYGSNRKFEDHPLADSIAAYRIDQESGELTLIGHTTDNIVFPRAFNFDPTGRWLYVLNQKGDTIVQFSIDPESGELSPTGLVTESTTPVSIVFRTGSETP
jgi:6-phosphogluconolactonase